MVDKYSLTLAMSERERQISHTLTLRLEEKPHLKLSCHFQALPGPLFILKRLEVPIAKPLRARTSSSLFTSRAFAFPLRVALMGPDPALRRLAPVPHDI